MKKLSQDLEILAMPLLIMLGVIVLFVIGGKVVFDNITSLNQKAEDNSKAEASLQTKLNSLQVAAPNVSTDSQMVLTALPASSSVFSEIYQLKQTATSFGLLLDNIESAQAPLLTANPVVSTEVDFQVDGTYQNIASFIQQIRNSAPVSRFDNIKIANQNSTGNNIFRLTATLFTYWSPLPTKLPSIDDPITELTADEKATVASALGLSQPNVIPLTVGNSQAGSTQTGSRANPFSP